MRVAATSAMTSSTAAASERTAPVQDMSPTVRYRTVSVRTDAASASVRGAEYGPTASSMPSRSNTSRSCA
ncbi:hypothetical protein BJF88_11285 [Cellulosimicrobium sp. CUA-896]|nr:hypothetical protein BJF88_11285 [Cellulosimicrobium sp. CUA-896]